jgi:hypothetical protein
MALGQHDDVFYMNSNDKCIACSGKRQQGESSIIINGKYGTVKIPLIKHHVRYDPEVIAYVHFDCHQIIHDPDDPRYKHLIQFQEGESREYYDEKKHT